MKTKCTLLIGISTAVCWFASAAAPANDNFANAELITILQGSVTGSNVEHRFRSEDKVVRADLDHHPLQYLYRSGDDFTFMNTENYEMSNVPADYLGEAVQFLVEGMMVEVSYYEGKPVAVDLPMFVEVEII